MSQSPQPSPADRLAIHELIALYGHLIDERQFSRLGEIFTADATFDLTGYDGTSYHGLPAIQAMMLASNEHPIAHHATNVVVIHHADSLAAISKGIGVGAGGRVGSVTYRDILAPAPDGWRISERRCELRTPDALPKPS